MSPDNALMLLLPFLIFFHSFLTLMFANSALYRYPTCDLSSGNFKCDPFYYLWEEKLTSSMVKGQFSCAFLCVGSRVFWLQWSLSLWVVGHWQSQSYWKAFCKCHIPSFQSLGKLSLHIWWLKRIFIDRYYLWNVLGLFSVSCESTPCMHGGVCVPEYEWNSYHCDCKPLFCGTHCKRGGIKWFVRFFLPDVQKCICTRLSFNFLWLVNFNEVFTTLASWELFIRLKCFMSR